MNIVSIYSEPGTKVVYTGKGGYDYQKEEYGKVLKVGETYTIEESDIGSWSSVFYLEEVPGKAFNTVLFAEEGWNMMEQLLEDLNDWSKFSTSRKEEFIELAEKIAEVRNTDKENKYKEESAQLVAKSKRRRELYYERQDFMKKHAAKWIKENLVVGDVVKVKSTGSQFRRIKELRNGSLLLQHVSRTRDKETKDFKYKDGYYITDHCYHNVTQVIIDDKWIPLYKHLKDTMKDV